MDARKLVGMTEGAKKRKARWESNSIMLPWRRAWRAKYGREYRIGTRLRPCPGKHGCVNCTPTCGACEDQIPDDTKCKQCGSVMTTDGPFCDGSGVLPARAKKVCK